MENPGKLQSSYLFSPSNGLIDAVCAETGYQEIWRDENGSSLSPGKNAKTALTRLLKGYYMSSNKLDVLKSKKLFLFDIDGTIAVGDSLYPGSAELLSHIDRIGGRSYFITNNSTMSGSDYVAKFKRAYGLETTEDQFVTSGYMTLRFLLENFSGSMIYVMGTSSFISDLRRNGLNVTEKYRPDISCVVAAYDNELTYEKLCETSRVLLTCSVPFYATNPDLRCPVDFGFVPDCGAMCGLLTATTNRQPVYLGKPSEKVVELCLSLSGFSREETLVVGDRLYTDIACGINGGVDACVLFTGEAQKKDLQDTPYRPNYAFENVMELYLACAK